MRDEESTLLVCRALSSDLSRFRSRPSLFSSGEDKENAAKAHAKDVVARGEDAMVRERVEPRERHIDSLDANTVSFRISVT